MRAEARGRSSWIPSLPASRLPDEELARIPPELNGMPLYDTQFRWHGASLAGFGILYNKKLLELYGLETPDSWEDLASPKFMDMVGSSDPRHSGSVHMMYEIILHAIPGTAAAFI